MQVENWHLNWLRIGTYRLRIGTFNLQVRIGEGMPTPVGNCVGAGLRNGTLQVPIFNL
jgi:hypothetical protein